MSNADRQKRYRDNKRNAPSKTSVTLPDGSTTLEPLRALHGAIARNARTRTVPIPGDPDYVGCCKLVAGAWQVDNTKRDVKAMPTDELVRRLHYIKDWQRSPEHQEVLRKRREAVA